MWGFSDNKKKKKTVGSLRITTYQLLECNHVAMGQSLYVAKFSSSQLTIYINQQQLKRIWSNKDLVLTLDCENKIKKSNSLSNNMNQTSLCYCSNCSYQNYEQLEH